MASAASLAAFEDAVEVRIPAEDLNNLTQPKPTTSTTPVATVLGAAVVDAVSEIEEAIGQTMDSSTALHVRLAVKGTLLLLKEYKQLRIDLDTTWDAWLTTIEKRARMVSGANRRLSPVTSTGLRPTTPLYADLLEVDLPTRANIPGGPTWPRS